MQENAELARLRTEVTKMMAEVSELKGTVLTEIRHLGHDIKNFRTGFEALVTRREWDERKAVSDERMIGLESRLAKIEDRNEWLNRKVLWAWLSGGAVVLYLLAKGSKVL